MNQRHIPFSYYYTLSDKRFATLGTLFALMSLFVALPFVFILKTTFPEEYTESYDQVYQKGNLAQARVIAIDEATDVTINNTHLLKLLLRYEDHGLTMENSFATVDRQVADTLTTGSIVPVKVYKGKVAVVGMDSVNFPVNIFLGMPGVFFTVGAVFAFIGYRPAFRKIKLLKNGVIRQGHISALLPFHGSRNSGRKLYIYYYYHTRDGNKVAAEDFTSDMKLLAFYKPEDAVTIMVDRDDETKSYILPQKLAQLPEWQVR